jgi:hypothetical protein
VCDGSAETLTQFLVVFIRIRRDIEEVLDETKWKVVTNDRIFSGSVGVFMIFTGIDSAVLLVDR